jgi:hypothetical protein
MNRLFAIAVLVLLFSPEVMALKKADSYYISTKTGRKKSIGQAIQAGGDCNCL